ncbi:high choriolytic enzyme 1-like isoform X2 [Epinephelus fuscoguttatus]|uniref:high choriolytic enzyme 1-like isoform X2 n=1 Tax=Epinephelus fuscoguttatus TaxID=293821 RepID=UPI0020D040B6|nr:high choriolytic enzyme 1-like isoform X2 [Epinephelus fuscoguttatus]
MAAMKCILSLLALIAVSVWTEAGVVMKASEDSNDEDDLTVSEQLENANKDFGNERDGIEVHGDIAVSRLPSLRNADPCVLRGCMWPKATDGKVYIPYVIANHYSSTELDVIKRGINSFSYSTCIRFYPRRNERDFIHIQSLEGCYSFVGRQGNSQTVSLSRRGCIYHGTVQHELLHALGFNHEQCRSDRDQNIRVLLQNIIKGQEYNFNKINTLNQGTPYDYGSVMHYGRLAFSKDNYNPTMVAVPNSNAVFGTARQMSQNDINRINLLYCSN